MIIVVERESSINPALIIGIYILFINFD